MSPQSRTQKIESYGAAYPLLKNAMYAIPQEMWQFRPAPERWTIHEIIIHIADSEANSYIRCRRLIAEPGSTILGYDEMKWASELNYHAQNTSDALELFKWLRLKSYTLIKTLPAAAWANTVFHTENGPMSLEDWLDTYERHVPEHIRQMQANYTDWIAQGKP
jgi:hypothetical protein